MSDTSCFSFKIKIGHCLPILAVGKTPLAKESEITHRTQIDYSPFYLMTYSISVRALISIVGIVAEVVINFTKQNFFIF